jgi:transcriptional regulator with XRE-family HTH domain
MAEIGWQHMTSGRQLFDRTVAEILGDLLAKRYGTAKRVARAVGISVPTAENIRKGNIRIDTLEKVLRVEGRALWDKLGDELFGETFYQFEERRIAAAIMEAESVRSNLVRLRSAREELLAGAGVMDPAGLGAFAGEVGRASSDARSADHATGLGKAQGQGDHAPAASVERRSFAPKSRGRK